MHRSIVGFHQDSEQHWVAEAQVRTFSAYSSRATILPPPLGDYDRGAVGAYRANTELRFMR